MLLLISFRAFAQEESSANEAMGFSRILRDPVAAGKAFTGNASSHNVAWATFMNPSLLVFHNGLADVSGSYQSFSPSGGVSGSAVSAGAGANFGAIGLTAGFVSARYEDDGGFIPSDLQAGGGAAVRLGRSLSIGASFRVLQSQLDTDLKLSATAFTLMATFSSSESFRLSAGLTNAGSLKTDSGSYPLASSAALAAEYDLKLAETTRVSFDADMDYYLSSGCLSAALGAEFALWNMIFVRGGYRLSTGSSPVVPSLYSFGAGFKFWRVRADVAWTSGSPAFSNLLTASLGLSF